MVSGSFDNNVTDTTASHNLASISNGTDATGTINGMTATGDGNTLSIDNSTLSLSMGIAAGFSGTVAFSINGGGAVFQTGPSVNANEQARIGLQDTSTTSLGGADGTLYDLGSGGAASLATDPTKAASIIAEASSQVTSLRGQLGAFQSSTLNSNISSLDAAVQNLTAAQSSIQDTRLRRRHAALTRSQVLVQSGTAVLSIANHIPDNVLSLLKQ